jgi:hypothetical protein
MASYDSPGGVSNPMPGLQGMDRAQTAPGSPSPGALPDTDSAGTGPEAGTVGNSAFVVPNFGSLVNGDRVDVSPADVLVSSQAASYGPSPDPLTGVGAALGSTGAGEGHAAGPPHPTAGVGLDGVQP